MAKILIIETSGASCSVAVAENGKVLGMLSNDKGEGMATAGSEHSVLLAPYIEELMGKYGAIDAVAVCSGPGSYTGLRIGLSTAKGLCYGKGIKLILVDSMRFIVEEVLRKNDLEIKDGDILLGMIDARRMEVYWGEYNNVGVMSGEITARILDENSFAEFSGKRVILFGSGAPKSKELLENAGVNYEIIEVSHSAASTAEYCENEYNKGEFADIAYSEPLYVKEWQPYTTIKK